MNANNAPHLFERKLDYIHARGRVEENKVFKLKETQNSTRKRAIAKKRKFP